MTPEIIFEDRELLALNKPAGWLTHATSREERGTLLDWIAERYPELKEVGEPIRLGRDLLLPRYGLLHRLDKDTSGIVLLAKTSAAFDWYKQLFQSHQIVKIYRAIVYGQVKVTPGVIEVPIGRSRRDPKQRAVGVAAKGLLRPAVTHYQVLAANPDYSYLELQPTTGRTHQLRVHLKMIGYPIVCDRWYAPKKPCPPRLADSESGPPELGRLALHALSLEFTSPSQRRLKLEAELPPEFNRALAALNLVC